MSEETRLEGPRVTLRAVRPDEYERVWQARLSYDGPGVRPNRERLMARLQNSGRLVNGWLCFAIETEGSFVGEIDARTSESILPPGTYEIGLELFDAENRGRGLGSEAITLLVDHLFDALQAERVQGSTWMDNTVMRRVFEKLGWQFEGVMRWFMPGGEGRDDFALYATTRPDWESQRSLRVPRK